MPDAADHGATPLPGGVCSEGLGRRGFIDGGGGIIREVDIVAAAEALGTMRGTGRRLAATLGVNVVAVVVVDWVGRSRRLVPPNISLHT